MAQAFHFKGVHGVKTGTGCPLPGDKVQGKIAQVRCLQPRTSAISAPRHSDWTDVSQIKELADEVRAPAGGPPIGYKLLAQHIKKDMVPLWLRAWKRQLCWSRLHRAVDQYAIQSTYGATLGAKKTIFIQ
jgi:glutamate synthase domain-containing protein 2